MGIGRASGGSDTAGDEVGDGAGNLDVVVGELSELGVIETQLLILGADAEGQTGDKVEDEEDDACHDERVRETGNAVGELIAELDVVVINPPTRDNGAAIKMGDVVTIAQVS